MLCPYDCANKTEYGYCKTTACINQKHDHIYGGSSCISDECPRKAMCARWYGNIAVNGICHAVAWYTFGGGTINDKGVCEIWSACGENGNWLKFIPVATKDAVVRCKDCKWWHTNCCAFRNDCVNGLPSEDDYCSHGQRKE